MSLLEHSQVQALLADTAMWPQELDDESRTVRFVFSFGQPNLWQAVDRAERLTLYSASFQDLIDRMQK